MLSDMEPGDVILIEQVDRLSRLNDAGWEILRKEITDKRLSVVSLDLPTSHMAQINAVSDDFTRSMLKAVNGMMLDMLAAIARKYYEDRRRSQSEGISKAKAEGKYRGRVADAQKHELIRTPQGGVISPLLANLFLHYAFDLWMEREYRGYRLRGTLMIL